MVNEIILTICVLLNLNLKRTYLNELLHTVHTSHILVTAPTNSLVLHTARVSFTYLLTYLLWNVSLKCFTYLLTYLLTLKNFFEMLLYIDSCQWLEYRGTAPDQWLPCRIFYLVVVIARHCSSSCILHVFKCTFIVQICNIPRLNSKKSWIVEHVLKLFLEITVLKWPL